MLTLQDFPTGPTTIGGDGVAAVVTADSTDEVVLATFTLPVLRKHDKVRVTALYTHTNSANDKTVKVKLGSTVMASKLTTAAAGSKLVAEIANCNATNAQVGEDGATATVETSGGEAVVSITGQKATGSETLTLKHWTVELFQLPVPGSIVN